MHPALFQLIVLGHKGAMRRLWRGAKSVRGALLVLFVLGFVGLPIVGQIAAARGGAARELTPLTESARAAAPFLLLITVLFTVLTSAGEQAIYFTPAEVDFLFPGPFTRRELLVYRLVKSATGLVLFALIFSAYELMFLSSWLCGAIGLALTLAMVQLLGMASALIGQTVAESLYTRARQAMLMIVLALLAVGLGPLVGRAGAMGPREWLAALRGSSALHVATAPFQVFTNAILARAVFPDGLAWSAAALAIDLALLALVLRLDAHYLEMAAGVSARIYERQQRIRQGGGLAAPVGDRAKGFRLPRFPWLGGVGPVAWRQSLIVVRSARGILMIMVSMAAFPAVIGWFSRAQPNGPSVALIGIGMIAYFSMFMVPQLPWAFRGDVDHIDFLKSLPVSSLALTIGELTGGAVVLTLVELLLFLVFAAVAPESVLALAAAALFLPLFNALLFALGNLLFLLYPVRAPAGGTFDFSMMGKVMLLFLLQFVLLFVFLIVPALAGGLAYWWTGRVWIALGAAWPALAAELPPLLLVVAAAFDRFDPSTQAPAE